MQNLTKQKTGKAVGEIGKLHTKPSFAVRAETGYGESQEQNIRAELHCNIQKNIA